MNRSIPAGLGLGLGLAACLGVACSDAGPPHADGSGRVGVVASVGPLAWVVERIAGPRAEVTALIPPGASPARHAPTVAERQALARARLLVKVGHPDFAFERAWLLRLVAERDDLAVVDASAGHADPGEDPHVWVAPARVREVAGAVETALGALMPEHAEAFAHNARTLRAEIDALDAEIRAVLAPFAGRRFFVLHPAWGHFAAAYGLEQVAIEAHHKEPDLRRIGSLAEQARKSGVHVVFVQPQFDATPAEALARAIPARVAVIDPLAYEWDANLRLVASAIAAGFAL